MSVIKRNRTSMFFDYRKKNASEEIKIPCAGCRTEMETYELNYDASSEEVLCKICRCAYSNAEQYQFEMEGK